VAQRGALSVGMLGQAQAGGQGEMRRWIRPEATVARAMVARVAATGDVARGARLHRESRREARSARGRAG